MEISKRLLRLSWKVRAVRKIYGQVTGRQVESDFVSIPGMTTLEERDFFYDTAKQTTGQGHIVDLGCWLGSTTIPLLKGLRDSNRAEENNIKVYAFDRFVWDKDMQEVVNWYPHVGYINPGSDFMPLFEKGIAPYKHLAKVIKADLLTYEWNNAPIELLLIDAMKSFDLTMQIAHTFLPSVITGKGIIIFQDFAHYYTSWLHFITYELKHVLEPINNVPFSGSMVFRKTGEIKPEDFKFLSDIRRYDKSYINRVFDHSVSLAREENKFKVIAAKAMWYVHDNDIEEANRVYQQEINRKYRNEEDVLNLRRYLPK